MTGQAGRAGLLVAPTVGEDGNGPPATVFTTEKEGRET